MSLTEKHHADDPHRAEPAAPPDHQETDGGAAGGRGRRGSPPEVVSGEATQVGLQVRRQGGGPEAREGTRDTTMARRRPAASTWSRGTTLRGRAGDRGEGKGREERERIHVQQRGLNGWDARHGPGPPGATPQDGGGTGREHPTEPRQMAMQCCSACMQGGGNQAEKSKKKKGNNRGQHPAAPQGGGTEKDEWLGPGDGPR